MDPAEQVAGRGALTVSAVDKPLPCRGTPAWRVLSVLLTLEQATQASASHGQLPTTDAALARLGAASANGQGRGEAQTALDL